MYTADYVNRHEKDDPSVFTLWPKTSLKTFEGGIINTSLRFAQNHVTTLVPTSSHNTRIIWIPCYDTLVVQKWAAVLFIAQTKENIVQKMF
jgi:hypothetical protein